MSETKPTNPKDLIGIKKLPILSVLSPSSIAFEAWAMRNGADKYGAFNYREKGVRASVYLDAALRHIFAWADGEELAEDSGVHHLAHAKACLGVIIDGMVHENLVDDRPPKSNFPRLLELLRRKDDVQSEAAVPVPEGREPIGAGDSYRGRNQVGEAGSRGPEVLPQLGRLQGVDRNNDCSCHLCSAGGFSGGTVR